MVVQVVQINAKAPKGAERSLPKLPVERVYITRWGLPDDVSIYAHEGNSLDYRVLIHTTDVIADLNNNGWDVRPGHLGENFTIDGLRYEELAKGQCYWIGGQWMELSPGHSCRVNAAMLELTERAQPKKQFAQLEYVGEKKLDSFLKRLNERCGWHAKVTIDGYVSRYDRLERG
jgi:MOSC domain-containing protein YiiM